MEQKILEIKTKPVLCVCRSSVAVSALVESSKKLSDANDFLLLLDYSDRIIERALPAFINSRIRAEEKTTRSKTAQMEMLLLICGTMQIGKALRECGIRDNEKFLLFATKDGLLKRFAKANGIQIIKKIKPKLNSRVAGNVAMTELLNE